MSSSSCTDEEDTEDVDKNRETNSFESSLLLLLLLSACDQSGLRVEGLRLNAEFDDRSCARVQSSCWHPPQLNKEKKFFFHRRGMALVN